MTTAVVNKIMDGHRQLIVQVVITGTAAQLSDEPLIDVSQLDIPCEELRLDRVHASLDGFAAEILWDATANVIAYVFSENTDFQDFRKIGGIPNQAGAGKSGNVLISTRGAAAGRNGVLVLEFTKRGAR